MSRRLTIILVIGVIALIWGWLDGPAARQKRGMKAAYVLKLALDPKLAGDPRFADVSLGVMTYPALTVRGTVPDGRAARELKAIVVVPPDAEYRLIFDVRVAAVAATQPATAPGAYDPTTFRADIVRYVSAGQFDKATALVKAADVDRQLKFDGEGYLAVGEDLIVLPGVHPNVNYDPKRDWYMPGTSDVVQDGAWQAAATEFAKRYNLRRAGKGG
jgi:hypothetical protein